MILILGHKKGNIQIKKYTSNKSNTNAITHRKKGEKLKRKQVIKNDPSIKKKDQRNTLHHVHHQKNQLRTKTSKKLDHVWRKKHYRKKGITLNKQNLADKLKW